MEDYNILSIDIGIHNIGYALYNTETDKLNFGLFDTDSKLTKSDKKLNIVVSRVKYINMFVKEMFDRYKITKIIIERQVNNNTMAMELMYALTATIYNYCDNIEIFDPKLKFTSLGISYNTKNKAHKKLSISIVNNYIDKYYNYKLNDFEQYNKLDDISDAVFMLFISLYKNDSKQLLKIKECSL